jgi:gamma-glutamylcyclotransferase (GGCT)/AIG2-like uncharacterized protein YtfP
MQTARYPFFVYGTLKPGESNYARHLAGRTSSEIPAQLKGAALFNAGAYPFLVLAQAELADLAQASDIVEGVLIDVPAEAYDVVLADLDKLEGYVAGGSTNLYDRLVVQVQTADGPREVWVYVAGDQPIERIRAGQLPRIASGIWQGA